MSFTFNCELCGQKLEAEDDYAGQRVNCPACGKEITVPGPQDAEADDNAKRAALYAELETAQEKQAEMEKERNELQEGIHADVARLRDLIVKKIKLGDYERAFEFARDEYCTEEDILVFLLEISYRDHNFDLALEYAEKLIEKSPDSSVGYRWKAEILDDGFGETEESIRFSTKAIELNPNDAQAYVIRGNTKRWMKAPDMKGAMSDYVSAIKIDKECGSAYSGLGWIALYTAKASKDKSDWEGSLENAQKLFLSSLETEGELLTNYGALQGMAAVLKLQGKPEKEFMPMLDMAIKLSPYFTYAYIQRADAKLERDTPPLDEIIHDYAKAVAFTKDFSKVNKKWLKTLQRLLKDYFNDDEEEN